MSFAQRGYQATTGFIQENRKSSLALIVGLVAFVVILGVIVSGALTKWWGLAAEKEPPVPASSTESPPPGKGEKDDKDGKEPTGDDETKPAGDEKTVFIDTAALSSDVSSDVKPFLERRDAAIEKINTDFEGLSAWADKNSKEYAAQLEKTIQTAGELSKIRRDLRVEVGKEGSPLRTPKTKEFFDELDKLTEETFEKLEAMLEKDTLGNPLHPTASIGKIVCPKGFGTYYLGGVAGDKMANCDNKEGLCNRCIGRDQARDPGSSGQWGKYAWANPSGAATKPTKEREGIQMAYNSIYVVDGQPPNYRKNLQTTSAPVPAVF